MQLVPNMDPEINYVRSFFLEGVGTKNALRQHMRPRRLEISPQKQTHPRNLFSVTNQKLDDN